MDRLTNLLKEHHVGEWCKRAAWIIVAISLIRIVIVIYYLVLQLQPSYMSIPVWVYSLQDLLAIIAETTFFFFVLYASGVFLNNFVAHTEDDDSEEDELIVEEEGEDLVPGQMTETQYEEE